MNLEEIKDPKFLKKLNEKELEDLCANIRKFIIDNISKTGGHLSSNLGAVELTVALHYVFNSPYDKLIFDVGHQSYTHKILTGRANKFNTLRQYGGISGFQKREESIHDPFEAGHSSTSIAAALGFEKKSVDGIVTSGLQRKGYAERIPAEVELEDGSHKQVKFIQATEAGMAYDHEAAVAADNAASAE